MSMDLNCSVGANGLCLGGYEEAVDHLGQSLFNKSCGLQWSVHGLDYDTCVTLHSDIADGPKPLINAATKHILDVYISVIGFIMTSLLGILGNVINIVVFRKQGLADSITLGFFALSISDLILVAMPLFTGSLYAVKHLYPNPAVSFSSIHYVSFGWVRNFMYSCSLLITAFISLERCCCIILPFKVQTLFTRKRTAYFLVAVFSFHAACVALLPAVVQLRWQPSSPSQNTSQQKLRVWFSEFGPKIEFFYSTTMSFVVPVGTQVIVTVCAFIMVRGLRKSARFRASATRHTNTQQKSSTGIGPTSVVSSSSHRNQENEKKDASIDKNLRHHEFQNQESPQTLVSKRDARLVKTVIFLVTILSLCNVPFLVATFAWRAIPDLNIGRPYQNMLSVIFSIVYVLGNLNAASNVLVYYCTSSRFKEVARSLFCSEKK